MLRNGGYHTARNSRGGMVFEEVKQLAFDLVKVKLKVLTGSHDVLLKHRNQGNVINVVLLQIILIIIVALGKIFVKS